MRLPRRDAPTDARAAYQVALAKLDAEVAVPQLRAGEARRARRRAGARYRQRRRRCRPLRPPRRRPRRRAGRSPRAAAPAAPAPHRLRPSNDAPPPRASRRSPARRRGGARRSRSPAARRSTSTCPCRRRSRCAGCGAARSRDRCPTSSRRPRQPSTGRSSVGKAVPGFAPRRAARRDLRGVHRRQHHAHRSGDRPLGVADQRRQDAVRAASAPTRTSSSSAPTRATCSRSTPQRPAEVDRPGLDRGDRAAARGRRRGRGVRRRRQHPRARTRPTARRSGSTSASRRR